MFATCDRSSKSLRAVAGSGVGCTLGVQWVGSLSQRTSLCRDTSLHLLFSGLSSGGDVTACPWDHVLPCVAV